MPRLAIVASHPIQYQAPLFRELSRHADVEVFFCHRQDAQGQAAAGFGVEFEWDVPLLDGYRHTWLTNVAPMPDVSRFGGCDTPDIATHLRDGGFDACLVGGWYLRSFVQAVVACRRHGVPVLSRGDSQLQTARPTVWRLAKYVPYRMLLNQFAAHLYVGQNNRAYLRHYGVPESRLFFSPHFVDTEFFSARADAARDTGMTLQVRRDLGLPAFATVFAFAGKLIAKKRPADFLAALRTVHQSGRNVAGLIIGAGPLQPELETTAAALGVPVVFAGFRNQSEMPAYLSAADCLVLPSDGGETWGLVVNEAMACGLPAIVSSAVGCGPDLIDDGTTGYRFPLGDTAALAASMSAVEDMLATNHAGMLRAVRDKMRRYTCTAAAQGVLAAVASVGRRQRGRHAA